MPDLDEIAGAPPTTTVTETVDRLRAILAVLPDDDGVAHFTRMYLDVTQGVGQALVGRPLRDPAYLARLDVVFANLYLSAFAASVRRPAELPRAWAPLFECRRRRGIAPVQHAVAGMNAHINRDLPIALVATATDLGLTLDESSPQHADFITVNTLLSEAEQRVKKSLVTGLIGFLDRLFGTLDDRVAMWDISRARDAAWANAELLWAVRDDPHLSAGLITTLDRTVGFAGRGLLVPSFWRFW
ncbi:MAG: hypothetical protein QOJ03_401 [Frankiaceae bacterium]|jgi:hypothetical protein|nr:hypothetical protein [Frankiaceae bacterium]